MEDVALNLKPNGSGLFCLMDGDEKIAEMVIDISGNDLTVYHTEVLPKAEGKGLAKKLLDAMVDYSRKNHLKVTALCPYVYKQFQRHGEEYDDIWKNKYKKT
ncbi:MAG TPA: GNAT family N-acetyltransferase [Chitinophagaceae bacterium]|nr:GNAT family N-acetyltransferase [Chitinophagaceae bacterium]